MKVDKFFNPICEENMYVITYNDNTCVVVDPGDIYMTKVINFIKQNNLILKSILLTHGHFDHIMGLEKILEYKEVPIYISDIDKPYLYDPNLSLSTMIGQNFVLNENHEVREIREGDLVEGFEVIKTPGHTKGSVCFLNRENKILISGDTILRASYGRVDFPTGDMQDMVNSIRKIMELEDDIQIFSGHGANTILKDERKYYYYF